MPPFGLDTGNPQPDRDGFVVFMLESGAQRIPLFPVLKDLGGGIGMGRDIGFDRSHPFRRQALVDIAVQVVVADRHAPVI